jgi:hypothetical protein
MSEDTVAEKLFREDSDTVRTIYREIAEELRYRVWSEQKDLNRPTGTVRRLLWRDRPGLTLSQIAQRYGLSVSALRSLLEHHGFLECVPYGGRQRRTLVSETAFRAEVGHNVTPVNRVGHLEGYGRAAPFPVLYEDRLSDIMWCLDYRNIVASVAALPTKRKRLAWILSNHSYLPDTEVANLAGANVSGVRKARQRVRASENPANDNKPQVTPGYHLGSLTGRLIRLPSTASERKVETDTVKAA